MQVRWIGAGACALCMAGGTAWAQDYPSRLIRIVVAQAPASGPDLVGRTLAAKFTESWGQQAIVDNRAGANGIIGGDVVAKAKPDGYTLLVGASSAITMNPFVYKSLPHDPLRDLAPVSQTASNVMALVVAPTLPAANVKSLVALAKARPNEIVFASAGIGNLTHLSAELFASVAGVKLVHAPYKGSTPAWIDLMSGQVALMFTTTQGIAPHLDNGKLKLLATCSEKRAGAFPQTPTLIESGYPGLVMTGWTGLFAPAGTPADILAKLSREVVRTLSLPEIRERMASQGSEAVASTPEVFSAFVRTEAAKWQKVIRTAGLEHTQ
jgi:tripartite-type tricarboxylate transporter receptor subunit TctC